MTKRFLIKILKTYQLFFSPDTGVFKKYTRKTCVFYPTCSEYTVLAIGKYGAIKGVYLGIKRILQCHPWQKKHIDLLK